MFCSLFRLCCQMILCIIFGVRGFVLTNMGTKKNMFLRKSLHSAETNLTLICPSPKSFVSNLPNSGRHKTRPNQGLSTARRENLGTTLIIEVFIKTELIIEGNQYKLYMHVPENRPGLSSSSAQWPLVPYYSSWVIRTS